MVLKEVPQAKVAEWLMRDPKKQLCLDEGKKDYEVPELTKAYACRDKAEQAARYQLRSLQKVVKEQEKSSGKAD